MKKFKNRATIVNAGKSLGNASSLPTLGVAPEMCTSLRPGMYNKHENVNDNFNERDGQYMDTGRTPSFDSTGKDIFAAQTRVTVSELAPSVVSCSIQSNQPFSVEPLPSRVVRKASKVGSNIVSDVIAGGASLLEGLHRSRQGEVVSSDKEQMGRLGDMGILSTCRRTDCKIRTSSSSFGWKHKRNHEKTYYLPGDSETILEINHESKDGRSKTFCQIYP